jgi:hypothetical protein
METRRKKEEGGMTKEEASRRLDRAVHARQSAVAFLIARGGDGAQAATPKHLRVGVDSAMSDHASLAGLLIKKGLITEDEYFTAIVEGAEREAESWSNRARRESGMPQLNFG